MLHMANRQTSHPSCRSDAGAGDRGETGARQPRLVST